MCGLLGLLTNTPAEAAAARSHAVAVMRGQHHRGPDEPGRSFAGGELVFGVNRLSVVDIEHAHQPLFWGPPETPGRYVLVFDGAIYNFRELRAELQRRHGAQFATNGDAEVVAAAFHYFGPDAVLRLRGMFAFLIWDQQRHVLFGARDPFGIKPLFVQEGPGGIAFASEKKCLLQLSRAMGIRQELDPKAVQHYLALRYVPEPETLHDQVRKIESGTSFVVEPGERVRTRRYFYPEFEPRPVTGEAEQEELYDELAGALRDSVDRHLRADVSVGALLSADLDSTAIAALARDRNPNLVTFTTDFAQEDDAAVDTAVDAAARAAAELGVRHVVRTVTAEETMAALPLIVWYLDDPVADPALVPLWFGAREARRHVKVLLSGEGADELFGGRSIYREPISLAAFEKVPGAMRKVLGGAATKFPGDRGKDVLRRAALRPEERMYDHDRVFGDEQLRDVLRAYDDRIGYRDVTRPWYRMSEGSDPVTRMQHLDLFTSLRGDTLVKADKVSMANSIELRLPFLDTGVFEVAARIPVDERITRETTKHALREAVRPFVPAHVLDRRKAGFPAPIRQWLRSEMYDWAHDIVTKSQTEDLIDKQAVLRMLDEHADEVADHSRQLWALLVFLLWHGIFVEGTVRPRIPEGRYPVRL